MRLLLSILIALALCAALFSAGDAEAARSGSWFPAAPMPFARDRHTATVLRNGDVLVAGGSGTGTPAAASIYHVDTNTWTAAGTMTTPRDEPTATLLRDGRVLLLGGAQYGTGSPLASGELYNPRTNSWSPIAPMIEPRVGHTATLLRDGRVLVLGGCYGECFGVTNNSWAGGEIYDPAGDNWTQIGDMPVKRTRHTATLLLDGRVLVVGGSANIRPAPAEVYDPATDTWSDTPEYLVNREFHTATRLLDGRVLVVGGDEAPCIAGPICGFGFGMQPEIYDPIGNTWTALSGPAPRDHQATLLKTGRVLVTGGIDEYAHAVASVDVYDPATNTWTTAESMLTPRDWHTATLLRNGRVLVAGGFGIAGWLSAAELYKPDQRRHR